MSNKESIIEIKKENKKVTFENIFNITYTKLKEKISGISIRAHTLHLLIKYVMEEVEETDIHGTEQKELALKLIRALVTDLAEGEDEKVLLNLIDTNTISNLIDLIVDATKGKLNINAVSKVSSGCVKVCMPYLCKKNKNKNKK